MSTRTAAHEEARPAPGQPAVVTDEEWLKQWEKHIQDLSVSFWRTYRLSNADRQGLAQDLRIKCISISQERRCKRFEGYNRRSLDYYMIDRWRRIKVHKQRYIEMSASHERRAVTPDAQIQAESDRATARMLGTLTSMQEKLIRAYTGLDGGKAIVDHQRLATMFRIPVTQVATELDAALQAMQAVVEAPEAA